MNEDDTIVLYPVDYGDDRNHYEYRSTQFTVDDIPGCVYTLWDDDGYWAGNLMAPLGVKETPNEGFVFKDYLYRSPNPPFGRKVKVWGVPGYDHIEISHEYRWIFDSLDDMCLAVNPNSNRGSAK